MYSRCVGAFLKQLFALIFRHLSTFIPKSFYKMYGQCVFCISGHKCDSKDRPPGEYRFKPFNFEKITPRSLSPIPIPRSGHRIGADSSNFYSFGGYNPLLGETERQDFWSMTYPLFQELWKFNFAKKYWTKLPNEDSLPTQLASNALLLCKNVLMVYGGTGSPFGRRCSNQLYICRVNENSGLMTEVNTTGHHPLPLYGQALVYHNDYLYTIGGTTGISYTCDIHRLNLKTLIWEEVYICNGQGDYEPHGRYRHEVGFDGINIYVMGGGTTNDSYGFKFVPAFNIEKKFWFKQKTYKDAQIGYPRARRCHGAVQIDTETGPQLFITGGYDGENIFDDLWRLDLTTHKWTNFSQCHLPQPVYFHAATVTPEGRLYVFGGNCYVNNDTRRTDNIYSTWLCVPKLSEMCWEAVLHYFPHLTYSSNDVLMDLGLPRCFVQRLGNTS